MRVVVDPDVCDAHGDCVLAAPSVFQLGDDDDIVTVVQPEPPDDVAAAVREAERSCPVQAIRIED